MSSPTSAPSPTTSAIRWRRCLQAAYLLQEAKLDGKNKKWAQAIDTAARDAARINREIRKILNSQS